MSHNFAAHYLHNPVDLLEQDGLSYHNRRQGFAASNMHTLITRGVAHDLNNLLFSMSARMELLLGNLDDASVDAESQLPFIKSEISEMYQTAHTCADLIQNLVAATPPEAMPKKDSCIASYIENLLQQGTIKGLCNAKGIELRSIVNLDCKLALSTASMDRALLNLVKNAMEAGAQSIAIKAFHEELDSPVAGHEEIPPGEYAVIEVWSDGQHIPEETIPHIFDPHYSTKRDQAVSGIGLMVFASVAKGHDGFYWATSSRAEGTSFRMYLPLS